MDTFTEKDRVNRAIGCWIVLFGSSILWGIIIGCGYLLYPIIANIK